MYKKEKYNEMLLMQTFYIWIVLNLVYVIKMCENKSQTVTHDPYVILSRRGAGLL